MPITAKHSHIKFKGTSYSRTKEKRKLTGNLTTKKVRKPITINVEFGGITFDGYDREKAGFNIDVKLAGKNLALHGIP